MKKLTDARQLAAEPYTTFVPRAPQFPSFRFWRSRGVAAVSPERRRPVGLLVESPTSPQTLRAGDEPVEPFSLPPLLSRVVVMDPRLAVPASVGVTSEPVGLRVVSPGRGGISATGGRLTGGDLRRCFDDSADERATDYFRFTKGRA